ncbi:response regulator transcription factor [Gangjinia marincola]|uniref:Response regulator transcription factor n=1 Tax=Gangjinia marincola TaxID=578463 RepID=A0ABP3XSJ8_9FLAO
MTKNIIIADDHSMFLEGMISMFKDDNEYTIILAAKDGSEVLKYISNNPEEVIDLIISDISMPDIDGITLNQRVKERPLPPKVLIVSMHEDANMIDQLMKANVDGYLPKNAGKLELLKAIRQILSGEKYFSQSIKEAYLNSVFKQDKESIASLTAREKEVLTLIAKEFTTQEIADQLFISKHTVESYRKNLLSKLNVRNLAGLTKYAMKLGLVK